MTLNELIIMQRELQTHSENQPNELEEIYIAQLDEIGELIHAIKWGMEPAQKHPAWAWWKRGDKPVATRVQVAGEIADLLCFVLLELIYLQESGALTHNPEDAWSEAWGDTRIAKMDVGNSYFADVWGYAYAMITTSDTGHITWLVQFSAFLGFTRGEIEAAYQDAYDKNVARWQAA